MSNDTNEQSEFPDKLHLCDAAAEAAEEAIQSLQRVHEEGIPQKAARLRREMFELVETTWLISALTKFVIENRLSTEALPGQTRQDLTILEFANTCEGCLHQAIHALEPLAVNGAGNELDGYLDGVIEEADEPIKDWMRGFFTSIYADGDRDQQVERLNAIFQQPTAEDNAE